MSSQSSEVTMIKSIGMKEFLRIFYPTLILIGALEVLLWVHWNSLNATALYWSNPKYSHGYLVPMFAAVLLWLRRDEGQPIYQPVLVAGGILTGVGLLICLLPLVSSDLALLISNWFGKTAAGAVGVGLAVPGVFLLIQPRFDFAAVPLADRWIGLGILVAAEALRMFATYKTSFTPEFFSIIPAVAGVFVMTGGLSIMKWAGWSILFLIFMLPLPAQLDSNLAGNLQNVATRSSTYLLQTIGIQASHKGNDMYVGADQSPMTVAEACSGLRMLTIFGALSFAVALLCDKPLWQRITIVASSIPIALIVNIVRITMTGILYAVFPANQEDLRHFGHDLWGWVMMPMALGLLFIEFKILSNLVIEDDEDLPPPISINQPPIGPKIEKPAATNRGKQIPPPAVKPVGSVPPAAPTKGTGAPKRPPREPAQN